jgi:hypothetical protein
MLMHFFNIKRSAKKVVKKLYNKLPLLFKNIIYTLYHKVVGHKRKYQYSNQQYSNQIEEFIQSENIDEELINIDAKRVLISGRLDLVCRYLFFKDIVNENFDSTVESLYARTILTRTGASEHTNFNSFDVKEGINSHIQAAKKLLEDIKTNGFKKEFYVPIAKDFGLFNGAHRLAASMALNESVWIRYCGENGIKDFDFEWFCKNGFSFDDKIRILRGFSDLYQGDLGIYVLYGPCKAQWDYIQTQIANELSIVGFVDIDLSHNYIAFKNLIKDIYNNYSVQGYIAEKIHLLLFSPLVIRIILVCDERKNYPDFYNQMINIKNSIRNWLAFDIDNDVYLTLHGSDTRAEFFLLKNILLSVNNLNYVQKRIYSSYRIEFLEWINELKEYCKNNNIHLDDICIAGSSPLEVVGIRDSTDIDIAIAPVLRKRYGDGISHLTRILDIGTRNYVRSYDSVLIPDDKLIYDDKYHFYFAGCKFANIDLVYYRKKFGGGREKDNKDVRLIELYNDFSRYFDEKSILQKQIEKELIRRGIKKNK